MSTEPAIDPPEPKYTGSDIERAEESIDWSAWCARYSRQIMQVLVLHEGTLEWKVFLRTLRNIRDEEVNAWLESEAEAARTSEY